MKKSTLVRLVEEIVDTKINSESIEQDMYETCQEALYDHGLLAFTKLKPEVVIAKNPELGKLWKTAADAVEAV